MLKTLELPIFQRLKLRNWVNSLRESRGKSGVLRFHWSSEEEWQNWDIDRPTFHSCFDLKDFSCPKPLQIFEQEKTPFKLRKCQNFGITRIWRRYQVVWVRFSLPSSKKILSNSTLLRIFRIIHIHEVVFFEITESELWSKMKNSLVNIKRKL